jgi:hypothetical protein
MLNKFLNPVAGNKERLVLNDHAKRLPIDGIAPVHGDFVFADVERPPGSIAGKRSSVTLYFLLGSGKKCLRGALELE